MSNQSNLAKNILTLIERRVGNRGWRGMKDWENIIIYMCATEANELEKYFPSHKKEKEEHNWNLIHRNEVKTKVDNFIKSL